MDYKDDDRKFFGEADNKHSLFSEIIYGLILLVMIIGFVVWFMLEAAK